MKDVVVIRLADAPAQKRKRKPAAKRAKAGPSTYEDPVFKASEVSFFPPGCEECKTTVMLSKPGGSPIREGYLESVRYVEKDGAELAEFTCSPASDGEGMFRFLAEAGCVPLQVQRRRVRKPAP